jgi:hypothetical protein
VSGEGRRPVGEPEVRNPKSEIRTALDSTGTFRASDLLRISDFGFRILALETEARLRNSHTYGLFNF